MEVYINETQAARGYILLDFCCDTDQKQNSSTGFSWWVKFCLPRIVLKGNAPITQQVKRCLGRHKNNLRKLVNHRISLKIKW